MEGSYLSHCAEDGRQEAVLQHLQETAAMAEAFASVFGAGPQGYLAGLMHDIGKYSDAFQDRLRGNPHRVDHSTAGAWETWQMHQIFASFAIAGHHSGLPDGGSRTDTSDQSTLRGRVKRGEKQLLPPYSHWATEVNLPKDVSIPDFLTAPTVTQADAMFFTRMIYSCLVDADFLCTERFMSGHGRDFVPANIATLDTRLQDKTAGWFPPKNKLNEQRYAILSRCRQQAECKPGLFTLTVPTGGGKTIASLSFALAHARQYHKSRVIYVIPYTSIIEQNAAVFRDFLGDDVVLEHHSGVQYDINDEATPHTIHMAQATENWDMPVIVTTAVQFFESLYASHSSQCRKLHNMANSVLIFDEAQMLPIPYLRPCVYAIAQLVQHYNSSAVLCTATQPALGPLFREFLPDQPITELCPADCYDGSVFQRTSFQIAGKLDWDTLSYQLNQLEQVLCIVNSRKSAQEIFSRLDKEGSFHLSTLMYPVHRKAVLAVIRDRLKKGLPCRVVSTSLIEAGVDVDFPAVYREQAGLDSILQAAGRCNREGRRSARESIVTVFEGQGTIPQLFSIPVAAWRSTTKQYADITSPQAIHYYFSDLLDLKGRSAQDCKGILQKMHAPDCPFRSIANEFHLIENSTRTIYIPLETGASLVEQLRAGQYNRKLFRDLSEYGVAVYENQFRQLEMSGALELLEDGSAILLDTSLYDPQTGLARTAESGNGLFL